MDAETSTIDGTCRALYAAISGPAGARDWTRIRGLFVEGARLIRTVHDASGASTHTMSVDEFVEVATDNFAKNGFFESEIARTTDEFGHIAQVFSAYECRRAEEEPPFARGINSIQLFFDGAEWKILSLLWDDETKEITIPAKYLEHRSS